jgi:hypothetical protein
MGAAMTLKTYDDVRQLTRDLEIIADWREDLASRLSRAWLRFDHCGISDEEVQALSDEVAYFARLCRSLLCKSSAERQSA